MRHRPDLSLILQQYNKLSPAFPPPADRDKLFCAFIRVPNEEDSKEVIISEEKIIWFPVRPMSRVSFTYKSESLSRSHSKVNAFSA